MPYDRVPGTLLRVRPGQVQRFGPRGKLKGTHLRFTPAFPPPFPGSESLLAPWRRQVARPAPDLSLTALTKEYTEQPVSAIAHSLGFGKTTNFSKFSTRMTGVVPGASG
ncbi:hypothetical protein PV682_39190 [Streptomyces niveiscabiei]|uniref:hypothetical protein n=1 Tax=Streptomyces niveiscabiei TaxID=164115 RepID=UPI0029A86469|nr:hypothetical protein [Streptomyces niveiscabiei]MDX3387427.1 hypothetical protein [Streptomyces niveiscabiei]